MITIIIIIFIHDDHHHNYYYHNYDHHHNYYYHNYDHHHNYYYHNDHQYHKIINPYRFFHFKGTAKGAGMIEPNMATMLAYLLTDLNLSSQILQQLLKKCVDKTFNALSIDGMQQYISE